MKILQEVEGYISLLDSRGDWLVKRVIAYGTEHKCLHNIDSFRNKWLSDIRGITKILIEELRGQQFWSSELSFENQEHNPFMSIAREHFSNRLYYPDQQMEYSLFIKYCRRAFIDLLESEHASFEMGDIFREFLINNFENLELAFTVCGNEAHNTSNSKELLGQDGLLYIEAFNHLYQPVLLVNANGAIQYSNEAAKRVMSELEYSDNENHSNISDIINIRLSGFLVAAQDSTQFKTSVQQGEVCRVFKIYLRRIQGANNEVNILVVLDDLTEHDTTIKKLKQAQLKAEESDRLKTAFLANMSHEIRTPMNAIIGFTELMLSKSISLEGSTEYLKLIRSSSSDLLNIIEDIIDVAKLESNQLKVKYKACKPYSILEDLKAVFTETLRKYGHNGDVELVLDVEDKYKGLMAYTDGERLKQVLTNLLSNAAKFTEKGSIKIAYKAINNSKLVFSVTDTGVGIPDEVKEKVFNRFFQVENHLPLNMGGAGLGLAISKSIIQMLGGTIHVDSKQNEGSCFTFQMPLRQVPKTNKSFSNHSEGNEIIYPELKGKTILIAEDDRTNYLYLKEVLSVTHVNVIWAKNGVEAIEHAEANSNINLILMDIKMPEIDGYQASKYISSINPMIPIIAQTAYAMDGDDIKCKQAGCRAYITKPLNKNKLFEIINDCLKQEHVDNVKALSV